MFPSVVGSQNNTGFVEGGAKSPVDRSITYQNKKSERPEFFRQLLDKV